MAHHKQRPEHGSLRKPVQGPDEWVVQRIGAVCQGSDNAQVQSQVAERAQGAPFEAALRDGVTEVLEGEGRGICQTTTALQI